MCARRGKTMRLRVSVFKYRFPSKQQLVTGFFEAPDFFFIIILYVSIEVLVSIYCKPSVFDHFMQQMSKLRAKKKGFPQLR